MREYGREGRGKREERETREKRGEKETNIRAERRGVNKATEGRAEGNEEGDYRK